MKNWYVFVKSEDGKEEPVASRQYKVDSVRDQNNIVRALKAVGLSVIEAEPPDDSTTPTTLTYVWVEEFDGPVLR